MRHVILGSHTTIGSSVVRLLASINAENIISVSPDGKLPEGVDPKKVTVKFGDIVDPYILNELFEENDIIYHCQIISDEAQNIEDAEFYNQIGFINLLGIATTSMVKKIVIALPQTLGSDLPEVAEKEDLGSKPSPIQKTLREMHEIAHKYLNGEDFGWEQSSIEKFVESAETPTTSDIEDEEDGLGDDNNNSGPKSPDTGPTSSSGPTLGGGPKMPDTGPSKSSGSSLDAGSKIQNENSTDIKDEDEKSETSADVNRDNKDITTVSEEKISYDPLPLVVGRFPRLFGPFDKTLTDEFCRAVRLQKLTVVGSIDKKITWINPIDAGRAMIILGDQSVDIESGEYIINGFIATPLEILDTLDQINHSDLDITHQSLFAKKFKHWFKSALNKIGFNLNDYFYQYKILNYRQVFDDSEIKEKYGWEPKFKLKQTAKDAMNWFTSHQL